MTPSPLPLAAQPVAAQSLASQSIDPRPPDVVSQDPLGSVEHSLASLHAVPLEEQAAVFEEIHRDVTRVLASTVQQAESTQASGTR